MRFSISKLTTDEGLSQGSNYFRFEDSKGFMWITGNDAVNRFDGSRVKVYNTQSAVKQTEFFKTLQTLISQGIVEELCSCPLST